MLAVTQCTLTRITAHQAAYKAGILHCDLSPGNIMLVGSETNIKDGMLIDWDLSKFIGPEDKLDAAHQVTHTVSIVSGTACLLGS
jgi:RIO-like serine/threonine protein kinase